MKRIIPGTVLVEGREFIYIEWESKDSFSDFFTKIPMFGNSPLPSYGGSLNEDIIIKLPNGKKMFGLSYKGDLEGWHRKIIECCEVNELLWGTIVDKAIKISNGDEFILSECNVELV